MLFLTPSLFSGTTHLLLPPPNELERDTLYSASKLIWSPSHGCITGVEGEETLGDGQGAFAASDFVLWDDDDDDDDDQEEGEGSGFLIWILLVRITLPLSYGKDLESIVCPDVSS